MCSTPCVSVYRPLFCTRPASKWVRLWQLFGRVILWKRDSLPGDFESHLRALKWVTKRIWKQKANWHRALLLSLLTPLIPFKLRIHYPDMSSLYIFSRSPPTSFFLSFLPFLFILTLLERLRSKRRFSATWTLHCTSRKPRWSSYLRVPCWHNFWWFSRERERDNYFSSVSWLNAVDWRKGCAISKLSIYCTSTVFVCFGKDIIYIPITTNMERRERW